jgi:hypothetical protein
MYGNIFSEKAKLWKIILCITLNNNMAAGKKKIGT